MKNSREKGARGEVELAKVLKLYGYDTRRGQQFHGGPDSPDVIGLPGIHIECKRVEKLNLYDAMAQSKADAGEDVPVVMHRRNRSKWLVTMELKDWMDIYREWEAGMKVSDAKDELIESLRGDGLIDLNPFNLNEEYQEAFSGITERRNKNG